MQFKQSMLVLLASPLMVNAFSQQRATPAFTSINGLPLSSSSSSFAPSRSTFSSAATAAATSLQMSSSAAADINIQESKEKVADAATGALDKTSDAIDDTKQAVKKQMKKTISLSTKTAVAAGTILALTSGFVNGACVTGAFSASQATAAVTGTWTNAAIAAAKGQNVKFFLLAKYLFSFMAGSAIAGLLVPEPVPFEVSNPKGTAVSFGVGALALSVAGIMAKSGGLASESILCLCFIANGIQNSLTSALTANLCRTTHFSGITSDIGTFLGQAIRGNRNNILKLKVFPLLAMAFWSGSFIAYPLTKMFASGTLLGAGTVYAAFAATLGFLAMRK